MTQRCEATTVARRYRVEQTLGHGATAAVFAAVDLWHDDRPVALKVLTRRDADAERSLAKEFAHLVRIQHPHIARVYEAGRLRPDDTLDGIPAEAAFLVQEHVEGSRSHQWAQRCAHDKALIAQVGAQVAAALATLHAHGLRHGDIQPANILVRDVEHGDGAHSTPTAKIIDFGLAGHGHAGHIAGTPGFLAPEVLAGKGCTASDIYALAAVLSTLLTGEVPSGAVAGHPLPAPALQDALRAMGHPDPALRASAQAAFDLLCSEAGSREHGLAALRDVSAIPQMLLGRPDLERLLDETLDDTRAGEATGARVLRLCGAPGAGKTAALTEAASRASARYFEVPGAVRSATSGSLAVLEQALGELSGTRAPAPTDSPPPRDDIGAARWQRFAALAEQLAEACGDRRVALLFDDVPAQSPLDELAQFLARMGPNAPSVVWIQSTTGNQEGAWPVGPLDVDSVGAMIRLSRPLRPTDLQTAEALHRASGGNPQTAMDILIGLPGDALLDAANRGELAHLRSLDESLKLRLSRLPQAARDLVTAVALLDTPVPSSLLARTPPLDGLLSPLTLDAACSAGLLQARGSEVGPIFVCPSDAVRRVLRQIAPTELVRAVAHTLEASDCHDSHAAELGLLWHRLGDAERAQPALLQGARRAAAALHPTDALALYDALLALQGVPQTVVQTVNVESGRILIGLGRSREALDRFAQAGDLPAGLLGRGEALLKLGRYQDAAEALEADLHRMGEHQPHAGAKAAWARMLCGDYAGAERVIALCREPSAAAGADHPEEVRLKCVEGLVCFYRGDGQRAVALLEEALSLAEGQSDAAVLDTARANLALVSQKTGDLQGAEALYEASLADSRKARDLPRQVMRLLNLATLRQDQGRFQVTLEGYRQAHDLARIIDGRREAVRVIMNWANLLVILGDAQQAREYLPHATADAASLGMATEEAYLHLIGAEVALASGEPDAAQRDVQRARELFGATSNRAALAETEAVQAEIALHQRDVTHALERADEAARLARECGRERVEASACLWKSLACLEQRQSDGASDLQTGVRAAWRATEIAQTLRDPDLGWLAHAALSRMHERLGHDLDAEFHLNKARQLASAVRARLSATYERTYGEVWYRRDLWSMSRHAAPKQTSIQPTRDFDRVLAINRELAQDHEPERLLERIIDAAIALSGAERGFVILRPSPSDGPEQPDDDALVVRAARNLDKRSLSSEELEFSQSIASQAMATGGPMVSVDALGDARFEEFRSVHHLQLRSVLCLPLRAQGGALGALYLDHRHRVNAFSETDVALLSAFGDQAAIALANARLVVELRQRSRELERSRLEVEELNQRLEQELAARSAELDAARAEPGRGPLQSSDEPIGQFGMVGRSAAMRAVYRVIERVSDKDVPVIIFGESGTGKELVARGIHTAWGGRTGPFVSVNCGAIPADLIESELFGHEKGAFTGAVRRKPGLFEVADGGTLFLDEVGELPLPMQVKLLRVLQQRELRRVGGTKILTTTARVVSASNRELADMVRQGQFREDLWYRLNVVEVRMPPLRSRGEDLPLLINHLVDLHEGSGTAELSRAARALLLDYPWPGNVRELQNEIQRALALAEGAIQPEDFSEKLRRDAGRSTHRMPSGDSLKDVVEAFERDTLRAALEEHGGKVAATARRLKLTRAGLYKKMRKYGLS